ncbi:MAG TPA: adenosylcobinamide-GDP ribazoletransferase [Holophagaceae bacterium]|nr:adenosylcobinamide-GDP ribazoletransferase [Holophagaceae bacterium]
MRGFLAAFRFLTRIPLPGPATEVADLASAVAWFPLVGAVVGLATAEVFVGAETLWPVPVAAALAVGCGLLLTGGFHEDGFTDAVDGLGGGWTKARVLEIMKDSRIGAYGAMGLWVMLMLRWSALVALEHRALFILPLAMVWGRWSIALLLKLLPPIAEGLAKEVHRRGGWGPLIGSSTLLLIAQAIAWHFHLPRLLPAAGAAIGVTLVWALYLRHRLGGHSGDVLGAGAMLVEAAALLVWIAR